MGRNGLKETRQFLENEDNITHLIRAAVMPTCCPLYTKTNWLWFLINLLYIYRFKHTRYEISGVLWCCYVCSPLSRVSNGMSYPVYVNTLRYTPEAIAITNGVRLALKGYVYMCVCVFVYVHVYVCGCVCVCVCVCVLVVVFVCLCL